MREIGTSKVRTYLSALLDEVACGETFIITRRGHPVAWLRPPEASGGQSASAAAATLRDLRKRVGWATTEEILQMRDEARR